MESKFKKITLPILAGTASLYVSILFFLGAIIGYILTECISKRIKSIRFSLGSYKIHLHHWFLLWCSFMIVFISGIHYLFPVFLLGMGGGVVFQGIYCYEDWHKIVSKKRSFEV